VTVGSYRRLIALPAALGKHAVTGARIDEGELRVRFTPVDPATRTGDKRARPGDRAGGDR
jgi:arsenite-transporting ATPase